MGPTNLALVNLFKEDHKLREVKGRLDAASKNVRVQERRVHDLLERQRVAQQQIRSLHARSGAMDLDLKSRDAKIERFRSQQQNAKNNKEYQTFLLEINTAKADRGKIEEDAMKVMTQGEEQQKLLDEITQQLGAEQSKLVELKGAISEKVAGLEAEIGELQPVRDAAAADVSKLSPKALDVYERLADRYDGEAVAPIEQPDPRRETYDCTACNLELVTDIYNKLKTRDELVFCPNCGRILYVPADLGVQQTIKAKGGGNRAAPTRRSANLREPGAPVDPVKAELNKLLLRAAGESARNAVAAGNTPPALDVYIDGKLFGTYKGQNVENFRRTARFCLQEAGVLREMDVFEKGKGPQSAAAGTGAPATPAIVDDSSPASPAAEPAASAVDAEPALNPDATNETPPAPDHA